MNPIIETKNFNFFYNEYQALYTVSLSFYPKHVSALIGPSGCGKTTLLRSINRMNDLIDGTHSEGSITLQGKNIYEDGVDPVEVRRKIGMVFQKPNPFPKTIWDNIVWGAKINGFTGDLHELVETSLRRTALWDEVKDKLHTNALNLSGGQQQRLCIARAIAIKPDVILMDEPTSALDPVATARIEALIAELKKRYSIIIVTHNMQQAGRVSDYTSFLLNGVVIEHGKTNDIFLNPQEKKTEEYISGEFG